MDYEKEFDDMAIFAGKMNFYRGYMINSFAGVEKAIDRFLINYFIPDKQNRVEFNTVIIDRLTFEAKRTALKSILDNKSKSEGFVKTKNNTYSHAKFLNEIRMLNEERIKFAHYYMLDLSIADFTNTELKDHVFGLTEFRDNVKIIWYTKEMYVKIIKLSKNIHSELQILIETLKPT